MRGYLDSTVKIRIFAAELKTYKPQTTEASRTMNFIFDFGNVIVNLDRAGMIRRFAQMGMDVERMTGIAVQHGIFGDLPFPGQMRRYLTQDPVG